MADMEEDPPAVPANAEPPSPRQRAALALGFALAIVGTALPALATFFLASLVVGFGVWSELLQQTNGLGRESFTRGLGLSLVLNATVVLRIGYAWLRARWRPEKAPLTTFAHLLLLYAGGLGLVVVDATGRLDVPDWVAAAVILGWAQLWLVGGPLAVLYLLGRGVVAAWRAATQSARATRAASTLSGALGLGGVLLTGAFAVGDALDYKSRDVDWSAIVTSDGVHGVRQLMAAMASDLVSPRIAEAPIEGTEVADPFRDCAEEIATARDANGRRVIENTKALLVRDGLDWVDAEDVTMETLLKVCLQHREKQPRIHYFVRAARKNGWKLLERAGRRPRPDGETLDAFATSLPEDPDVEPRLELLRAAMEELSESDRRLLLLHYEKGMQLREIARLEGASEAAIKQRAHRARQRLERAYRRRLN